MHHAWGKFGPLKPIEAIRAGQEVSPAVFPIAVAFVQAVIVRSFWPNQDDIVGARCEYASGKAKGCVAVFGVNKKPVAGSSWTMSEERAGGFLLTREEEAGGGDDLGGG